MDITTNGTTVTYTRRDLPRTLRHRTNEQAELAVQAIRECDKDRHMTVAQFHKLWKWVHAESRLGLNTRHSYDSTFRVHILPQLGSVPIADLDEATIRVYIDDLAQEAGCYRKATPTVIRLQAFLSKAVDWGLIDQNPVFRIDALFLGGKPEGLDDAA